MNRTVSTIRRTHAAARTTSPAIADHAVHPIRHTARQLSDTTVADMYRALDHHQPIRLIGYLKADGTTTTRTIEPIEVRTTKAGNVTIKAMDRQSGESRSFRVDRITAYQYADGAYQVERTTDTPAPVAPRTVAALTAYEIARQEIAAADRRHWATREYATDLQEVA